MNIYKTKTNNNNNLKINNGSNLNNLFPKIIKNKW